MFSFGGGFAAKLGTELRGHARVSSVVRGAVVRYARYGQILRRSQAACAPVQRMDLFELGTTRSAVFSRRPLGAQHPGVSISTTRGTRVAHSQSSSSCFRGYIRSLMFNSPLSIILQLWRRGTGVRPQASGLAFFSSHPLSRSELKIVGLVSVLPPRLVAKIAMHPKTC